MAFLEIRQGRASNRRGAQQVHGNDVFPIFAVDVGKLAAMIDAGGGHDTVEATAVRVGKGANGSFCRPGIGDIDDFVRGVGCRRSAIEHQRLAARRLDRGDHSGA